MGNIDFGDFTNDLGGAASDLFSSFGSFQAAGSYRTSATYSRKNADLERESLAIKQAQLARQTYNVIGGQKADVASAGFSAGGSALDLLRDSASQGALAKAQQKVQGDIAISQYEGAAKAEDQQAQSEDTAGLGDILGTAFKVGAAILPFFL